MRRKKVGSMPETMTVRDAILRTVEANQGLKGVDLVVKVMGLINPNFFTPEEFNAELMKLVNERMLVELTYELSNMDYRTKSMYFPKGTRLHFMV